MDNKNKEIRTINVEGVTYDVTDPNVPEWFDEEIEKEEMTKEEEQELKNLLKSFD